MKVRGSLGLLATVLTALLPGTSSADDGTELAVLKDTAVSRAGWLAFSADGALLATVGGIDINPGDRTFRTFRLIVWDVGKQQPVWTIEPSKQEGSMLLEGAFSGLWMSSDGKTLVTHEHAHEDTAFRVWDGTTGKFRGMFTHPPSAFATASVMSSDGALLAVAWNKGFVLPGRDGNGVHFGDIAIVDLKTAKVKSTLPGDVIKGTNYAREVLNENGVKALAFSPDGAQLATVIAFEGDEHGQVKIWNLKTGKVATTLKGPEKLFIRAGAPILEWLADGKTLVLRQGTSLELWDTTKGEHTDAFSLTGLPVEMPSPKRPGPRSPAGDSKPGASPIEFERQSVLSADGTRLAVQMVRFNLTARPPTMESEVVVWDVAARHPQGTVKLEVSAERLKKLARIAESNSGRETKPMRTYVVPIALSPDGKLLAIGDPLDVSAREPQGSVRVYEVSKLSAKSQDADAARARSKWEGTARHEYVKDGAVQRSSSAVKLIITERNEDAFTAEHTGENGVLEVAGTIDKSGNVKWEVKRIIKGHEKLGKDLVGSLIGSGTLKGKNMSLNWSLKETSHRGTIELELKE